MKEAEYEIKKIYYFEIPRKQSNEHSECDMEQSTF